MACTLDLPCKCFNASALPASVFPASAFSASEFPASANQLPKASKLSCKSFNGTHLDIRITPLLNVALEIHHLSLTLSKNFFNKP
jgi:hypothetical protein